MIHSLVLMFNRYALRPPWSPTRERKYGNGSPISYDKVTYLLYSGSYFPVVLPA